MRPENELPWNVLSLLRRRIFGSGAVDALRRRALRCALAALLSTTAVCVPPAGAQDQVETAYAAVKPSLVLIENYKGGHLFATGTGFVIGHRDGHMLVVTNRHVVVDGDSFEGIIQFPKQVSFGVTVLALGEGDDDLALLESTELDAPALTLATTLPALGHAISIAGYPHTQMFIAYQGGGLSPSVHAGNVNALPQEGFYIQYDAQTDHGNSGGPLFDLDSSLVYGIVVLKMGTIETNFAISAIRIRTFLANEGVFPAAPAATLGSVNVAPPAPAAASPTNAAPNAIDHAACVIAVKDFVHVFEKNEENFAQYVAADHATTESLHAQTYREKLDDFNTRMPVELALIRAIIRDDEPALYGSRDQAARSGAVVSAQRLDAVITDMATRDQDELQSSLYKSSLIATIFNGRWTDDEASGPLEAMKHNRKMAYDMQVQVLLDLAGLAKPVLCKS